MKEITDAALADLRASLSVCNPLVQSLVMRLERVEGELEREHIRLAACGVAALCNTEDSMAQQIVGPGNQYYSASYGDVISAVNREMALRERVKRMEEAYLALKTLCRLKKHKDQFGKTELYQQEQPEAWAAAMELTGEAALKEGE